MAMRFVQEIGDSRVYLVRGNWYIRHVPDTTTLMALGGNSKVIEFLPKEAMAKFSKARHIKPKEVNEIMEKMKGG